jgi:hypothetical protein
VAKAALGGGAIALIVAGIVGVVALSVCCLGVGLLIPAVQKVREAAARTQSQNNCRQMGTAINNMASGTTNGDIPPAWGTFPPGSSLPEQSFFNSLLPYIEGGNYATVSPTGTVTMPPKSTPIKTFIAPADPYNPGTDGRISYAANGVLLRNQPRIPNSFGGRTSGVIVVFERSNTSLVTNQTWSSNNTNLGTGEIPPNQQDNTGPYAWPNYGSPASWRPATPHAITPAGCMVTLGDGSARTVTQGAATGTSAFGNGPAPYNKPFSAWSWAIDSNNPAQQPAGW